MDLIMNLFFLTGTLYFGAGFVAYLKMLTKP